MENLRKNAHSPADLYPQRLLGVGLVAAA